MDGPRLLGLSVLGSAPDSGVGFLCVFAPLREAALQDREYIVIGVMRGGAVGDFVLTLPAIDALRRAHPGEPLRLIANPALARLAQPDQVVDHGSATLASLYAPVGTVSRQAAAAVTGLDILLAYAIDADGILSARLGDLVDGSFVIHDPRPSPGSTEHITDHLLTPLSRLRIPADDPCPRIRVADEDRDWADRHRASDGLPERFVVVHPGSGGRRKCWPVDRFLGLIREIDRNGVATLVFHGPAESDLVPMLQSGMPTGSVLLPSPDVSRLAAVLEGATLFIGNDAGPGHIATAVGTPALSLFGPTDPRVWSPRSESAEYIQAPGGDLSALEVERVRDRVMALLSHNGSTTDA